MGLAEKFLPRYTFEDYKKWKGDWELIEGIPYAMAPSPLGIHQQVLMEIGRQILNQVKKCKYPCYVYPELDWIVDEETVLRPDLMVICKKVEKYLKETPEVVFEIVSKSTAQKDEQLKFLIYEREKVNFYVLVYPDLKKLRIFFLRNGKFEKVYERDEGTFEFELKNGCKFFLEIGELFAEW
ncbi:MAG: Uma2 family endonuclease [Desulfurobacterium sp.]|nr:MAG: Uma2 family endonuclease [Desulfurobacterium sp.]